ncbi:MAG TPA: class I SAM-dependent methyltransferase [Actinomycetota bacterium]|nr:class I SAM-dependent methyltransferase [Actinomycetota bacterium]
MDERLRKHAEEAIGFMPEEEGLALYEAGLRAGKVGPLLEIGSYCGKSAVYLGAAARERNTVVYSIDHHRGSEEQQPGETFHDPRLVDPSTGVVDTLPFFRRTLSDAGLEDVVIGIVGESGTVVQHWDTPLGLVFIDGGHSEEAARNDYACWAPHVMHGGLLAIHDVFEDPEEGGRPPFLIFRQAVGSGSFKEVAHEGSLRVLERV